MDASVFLAPGALLDGDLALALEATRPANPGRGFLPAYRFAMRRCGSDTTVGEIGLKIGQPPDHLGHVWYRVSKECRGNHYAARALKLLVPLARWHGIDPIRITNREENAASRRTCELAGATFVRMVETPEGYRDWLGPVRIKCVYHLATGEGDQDRWTEG